MIVEHAERIQGTVRVPGDKSISHRALILGTMVRGEQTIEGLPQAADIKSTIKCLKRLGASIETQPDGSTKVVPRGFSSGKVLQAGNSGTTARLLAGLLAGHKLEATIDGDTSLRKRPMARVADPLTDMGADITTSPGGVLPIKIRGGNLRAISYRLPVPSAQVKSAILIAGVTADGVTTIEESIASRDHTEKMLLAMGAKIEKRNGTISLVGNRPLEGIHISIPGDFSSAAYFCVAAACLPGSDVCIAETGVNATRTGLLAVLDRMGAVIDRSNPQRFVDEPVADLYVKAAPLRGVTIDPKMVPSLIDELPILAVAATQAEGETIVQGAQELRHKESNRIDSIVTNLKALGADIEATRDGFIVRGPVRLKGGVVTCYGDHRIAMAMAIAGLIADGKTKIQGSSIVDISYPGFFDDLRTLTPGAEIAS